MSSAVVRLLVLVAAHFGEVGAREDLSAATERPRAEMSKSAISVTTAAVTIGALPFKSALAAAETTTAAATTPAAASTASTKQSAAAGATTAASRLSPATADAYWDKFDAMRDERLHALDSSLLGDDCDQAILRLGAAVSLRPCSSQDALRASELFEAKRSAMPQNFTFMLCDNPCIERIVNAVAASGLARSCHLLASTHLGAIHQVCTEAVEASGTGLVGVALPLARDGPLADVKRDDGFYAAWLKSPAVGESAEPAYSSLASRSDAFDAHITFIDGTHLRQQPGMPEQPVDSSWLDSTPAGWENSPLSVERNALLKGS
jgi:hypothetical protein